MDTSFANGGKSPNVTESLWQWLSKAGSSSPHLPAVVSAGLKTSHLQPFAKSRTSLENSFLWNYEDLLSAVDQLASYFTSRQIQPRDCLVCYVSNSVDYVLLFWTSARLGAIFAPVLPTTLDDESLSQHYLDLLNPKLVAVQDAAAATKLDGYLKNRDCLKLMVAPMEDTHPSTWAHIEDAATSKTSLPDLTKSAHGYNNHDLVHVRLYGPPESLPAPQRLRSDAGVPVPVNACQGVSILMLPRPWPEPEKILKEIERQNCTHVWATSSLLYKLGCAAANTPTLRPTKLETVLTSGEVTHESKVQLTNDHLRPKRFLSLWGMTEGAPHMGWSRGDVDSCQRPPVATPGRIAAVGRALPGTTAKIAKVDSPCDDSLPRGDYGMLHLSSQGLIHEYLGGKGADDFYTDASGKRWFKTGDLGMMDADGYFYLLGRVKELIWTRKGMAVPCILDNALQKIFGCEALVVGVPEEDEKFSVPVAVLKMNHDHIKDLDGNAKTELHSTVGEHYVPRQYISQDRLFQDGQWPTNSAGKFARGDLQSTVIQYIKQGGETLVC